MTLLAAGGQTRWTGETGDGSSSPTRPSMRDPQQIHRQDQLTADQTASSEGKVVAGGMTSGLSQLTTIRLSARVRLERRPRRAACFGSGSTSTSALVLLPGQTPSPSRFRRVGADSAGRASTAWTDWAAPCRPGSGDGGHSQTEAGRSCEPAKQQGQRVSSSQEEAHLTLVGTSLVMTR